MTSTFSEHQSDIRIFVFSALGSLFLHALLMIGLASMPQSIIEKDKPPTVQITLMPSPEILQTPQSPTPRLQPRTAMLKASPPPQPLLTQPHQSQTPPPPLQASLTPSPRIRRSPLTPPVPAKSILKDTQASQAMKARGMMKMREPSPVQQASPSLPTVKTRTSPENRALPPIPPFRKERSTAQSLPPLTPSSPPRPLTATPPAHMESTTTRPAIISSSRPVYPRVARESGWEGTVVVRTLIDKNGLPSKVKIHKSCGHPTLDEAAQDAVRSWTFHPAKDGNIPITKWVDIPIKFDLNS